MKNKKPTSKQAVSKQTASKQAASKQAASKQTEKSNKPNITEDVKSVFDKASEKSKAHRATSKSSGAKKSALNENASKSSHPKKAFSEAFSSENTVSKKDAPKKSASKNNVSKKTASKKNGAKKAVSEKAVSKKASSKNNISKSYKEASHTSRTDYVRDKTGRTDTLTGIFRMSGRGFGFVTTDAEFTKKYNEDIFIAPPNTNGAVEGDSVEIEVSPIASSPSSSRRSREGKVVYILAHTLKSITGTLCRQKLNGRHRRTLWYVQSDDKKLSFPVYVDINEGVIAKEDDKVTAEMTSYPTSVTPARGIIVRNFGDAWTREANYASILAEHGIETEFSEDVLRNADEAALDVPSDNDGRLDLRDSLIFTIDGADAKDLDDAVSLEKQGDFYLLGVHIADVSYYVTDKTALDDEAFARGTSVYFTDKVVPMLPRALSNGICSLNGGEDRRALSAIIKLSSNGEIVECNIKKTLIRSRVRGVYSEVNDIIKNKKKSQFAEKYSAVYDMIGEMRSLYKILYKKSRAHGALELETPEAVILLDDNGYPCDIVKRERGEAEKMIEQFMLAANEAVANWLFDRGFPCVYRIHEEPSGEKLADFTVFAHNLGLPVKDIRDGKITGASFEKTLAAAAEKGISQTVSYMLLRSMMKARYSAEPIPHFGLGIDKYCHFTSPIRRYPDLFTHRIIKFALASRKSDAGMKKLRSGAVRAAEQSSQCELRAVAAERDIEDLYKCMYMFDSIGEEFNAIISSVTGFGFFAELDNTCEGLVPVGKLPGEFRFDEKSLTLSCGERVYRMGDRVRVKVDDVNIITRRIDLIII